MNDLQMFYGQLEDQLHIGDLKQRYDEDITEEVVNNICEMYISETTRIGGRDVPRSVIRGVIRKLKMHHIEHVIDQFYRAASQHEIHNTKRYLQTMIYNSIFEANAKVRGHIKCYMGY